MTKNEIQQHLHKMNDNLKQTLMNQKNYKVFYWAPDYSFCGFATPSQVESTAHKWLKDRNKLGVSERQIRENKDDITHNVSAIP